MPNYNPRAFGGRGGGGGGLSKIEHERRVDIACAVLEQNLGIVASRKLLTEQFQVGWRQAQRYLAHARKRFLQHTQKGLADHRREAYMWLVAVRDDAKTHTKERLQAQKQLTKLLGLNQPTKIELAGVGGQPLLDVEAQRRALSKRAIEAQIILDEEMGLLPVATVKDGVASLPAPADQSQEQCDESDELTELHESDDERGECDADVEHPRLNSSSAHVNKVIEAGLEAVLKSLS